MKYKNSAQFTIIEVKDKVLKESKEVERMLKALLDSLEKKPSTP